MSATGVIRQVGVMRVQLGCGADAAAYPHLLSQAMPATTLAQRQDYFPDQKSH